MDRVIGHFDLDYFYAQVEEVQNPSIKGRPVIVCVFSGRTHDSGVVSTANYEAREIGVTSGMPIVLAKKKLQGKDPVIVRMEHQKYEAISERIMQAVRGRVDVLEQTGIDEAFFDLTVSTSGNYQAAKRAAEGIKRFLLVSERLTCSMGIGRSKAVAKLSSDLAKPAGLEVVPPETTESFLSPLPVAKLYGIGPKTAAALGSIGVKTIGELARAASADLEGKLGKKLTAYLKAASIGTDEDPVVSQLETTQFSRIVTLKRNTRDHYEALRQLDEGINYIHERLAAGGKSFRTVTAIGILTDLSIHTKSKTFEKPVKDATTIRKYSLGLFKELGLSVPKEFRRVGLRVSGLVDDEDQKSLSEFLQPAR